MSQRINKAGIDLIKSFEGLRLEAYQDSVGIWTIGYGHTGPEVVKGLKITAEEAENILCKDLDRFEIGVAKLASVSLTSNQFSALVSFSFNVGLGNLKSSTLLKKLNLKDFAGAAEEFLKWNKAGGVELKGLTKRRTAEKELFLTS